MKLIRYENAYTCPECGTEWTDDSSSENNDHCPKCDLGDVEPESSKEYETDDSGKGDIVVIVKKGIVDDVRAPAGLSVLVLDYDVDMADGDELARDEDGDECKPTWLVEPGEANAAEKPQAPPMEPPKYVFIARGTDIIIVNPDGDGYIAARGIDETITKILVDGLNGFHVAAARVRELERVG